MEYDLFTDALLAQVPAIVVVLCGIVIDLAGIRSLRKQYRQAPWSGDVAGRGGIQRLLGMGKQRSQLQ